MNRQKTNILIWLRHLCLGCIVAFGLMTIIACGSGDDDEAPSGDDTIQLEWQYDQIIVEVTSGGDAGDILTTPVGALNNDDTSKTNWTLTQLRIDNDNNGDIDEVYTYEYDTDGYLETKTHYPNVDGDGNPTGNPDEITEYNVDNGVLDEIEYDTDGNGTVDKITDYDYDDGSIDKEEIYLSSSKDGDPDETWRYDYNTSEGAFLKERYIGGADDASETIAYNSHGDITMVSANPDDSGEFQSIITISNSYDHLDNITTTTTIITIGGADPETDVVTYQYTYNDLNGNLESYEADDGDDATTNPVTYFRWE